MERIHSIEILSVLLLLCGGVGGARADEAAGPANAVVDEEMEEDRRGFGSWGVSLSAEIDVLMVDAAASIESNLLRTDKNVSTNATGTDFFVNPLFGVGIEVRSPSLFESFGHPRVYFGAGYRYAMKLPHTLALSGGKPEPLPAEEDFFIAEFFQNEPPGQPGSQRQPMYPFPLGHPEYNPAYPDYDGKTVNRNCEGACDANFIAGQGTAIEAKFGHLYWQTELGVVFSIPLEERTLLIKPAIGYFQQSMQVTGKTHRVYRDSVTDPMDPDYILRAYTSAELDGEADMVFRGIGPKVTLELQAARVSKLGQDLAFSVFLDAGVFWNVGNRGVDFFAEQTIPGTPEDFVNNPSQPTPNPQRVDYHFQVNKMSYRFGAGFRITWDAF